MNVAVIIDVIKLIQKITFLGGTQHLALEIQLILDFLPF